MKRFIGSEGGLGVSRSATHASTLGRVGGILIATDFMRRLSFPEMDWTRAASSRAASPFGATSANCQALAGAFGVKHALGDPGKHTP